MAAEPTPAAAMPKGQAQRQSFPRDKSKASRTPLAFPLPIGWIVVPEQNGSPDRRAARTRAVTVRKFLNRWSTC